MGRSTDAILFYGFHAGEGAWDEILGGDWETTYVGKKGVLPPPVEYDTDEHKAQHRTFWSARSALVTAEPCTIGTHCSSECPMPFVCIRASKTRARRGHPEEIKPLAIAHEHEWSAPRWDAQLKAFCELMGIPWQTPGWWIVSDWS